MKVLKFGGTSVADSKSINNVISILEDNDEPLFIIVSALGGITNLLQKCVVSKGQSVDEIINEIEQRHLEVINNLSSLDKQSSLKSFLKQNLNELEDILDAISTINEVTDKTISKVLTLGEILSSCIIYEILKQKGFDISYIDSRELIFTKEFNNSQVLDSNKTSISIKNKIGLIKSKLVIAPGYICSNEKGETSNLGRGGSDYSAAIYAKNLNAKVLEIWTDVSGVFTANPKIVKKASPIEFLSYKEAMELSFFGAKVIYFPTLQPLIEDNIPVFIKNTFEPGAEGTCISNSTKLDNDEIVKGISHIENISILNFEGSGMVGVPGFSKRFFEALSSNQVNVVMITQASSEHSICIGVKSEDALAAKKIIDDILEFGRVQEAIIGFLPDLSEDDIEGVKIGDFAAETNAKISGLKVGDVIVKINDVKISKFSELTGQLSAKRPGDFVKVTVKRGNDIITKNIKLIKRVERFISRAYRLELIDTAKGAKIIREDFKTSDGSNIIGFIITKINDKKITSAANAVKLLDDLSREGYRVKVEMLDLDGDKVVYFF